MSDGQLAFRFEAKLSAGGVNVVAFCPAQGDIDLFLLQTLKKCFLGAGFRPLRNAI